MNLGTFEHRKHVKQRLTCVGKVRERLKDRRHYIWGSLKQRTRLKGSSAYTVVVTWQVFRLRSVKQIIKMRRNG